MCYPIGSLWNIHPRPQSGNQKERVRSLHRSTYNNPHNIEDYSVTPIARRKDRYFLYYKEGTPEEEEFTIMNSNADIASNDQIPLSSLARSLQAYLFKLYIPNVFNSKSVWVFRKEHLLFSDNNGSTYMRVPMNKRYSFELITDTHNSNKLLGVTRQQYNDVVTKHNIDVINVVATGLMDEELYISIADYIQGNNKTQYGYDSSSAF